MVFLIFFLAILVWMFLRAKSQRGKNFVQSFYFLLCLKKGKSVKEANGLARCILTANSDPDQDKRFKQMASELSQKNYQGKQLPLIHEAVSKGFSV